MNPNEGVQLDKIIRNSPDLLSSIIGSAMDAIVAVDDAQHIILFNAAAERVFACPANEAIGSCVERFIPERFRAGHRSRVRRFGESGVTNRTLHGLGTLWGLRATGEEFPLEASISKFESGGKRLFTVVIRDITKRQRTEEALRASEERLRLAQQAARIRDVTERKTAEESRLRLATIVESSDDAIISKHLDGVIVSWNAGAQRIYGYTEAEAVGKPITILIPTDLVDEENNILKRLSAGERIHHYETLRVTKAGKKINISLSLSPIKDSTGRILGLSSISRDITDRKRAEEALLEMNCTLEAQDSLLRSREELLRIFVKNVPAAVAMLDRDMRYLQVSDRWCSDNSVEASELLGRLREELPEMPERWKEVNRRALQGETLRADEDRWESRGSTRWARWEVRPWKTAEGAVGGILVFAEDITHRKHMEDALSDLSRKLIESQEQERARIGRELHDDINQRLAMLSVELEQLHENPAEIQSRVKELLRQIAEVSDDVQALSHDLHSSKLEYLGVVAGMKSWCQDFAERQKMEIAFSSNVFSVLPLAVGRSLFRVLQEALHNAQKHSGVKRIEIQLREHPGEIHLVLSDWGRGFDVEAASQGKGLGLTSMRERVRLVNGTISIESKPMGGTIIRVCVPLEPSPAKQEAV